LVLTVTVLVSVSEAKRSARVSSIWDVILGTDPVEKQQALKTNVVKTHQSSAKPSGKLNNKCQLLSHRDPNYQLLPPMKEREKC